MVRWMALGLLAGCGGGQFAEVGGSIGTVGFDSVETVFHGGPYILLFDRELDCTDVYWAEKTYSEGALLGDSEFVALQFGTDDPQFSANTFSVAADAAVTSFGLIQTGGTLEVQRGREGTITVTEVDEDYEFIEAEFEVGFTEGIVRGEFRSEYCRNLQP